MGIREESETLAIRDRNCIADLSCRMEHKRSLPGVLEKQCVVIEQTSRKRQSFGITSKIQQKLEQEEKRTITIEKVEKLDERLKTGRKHNYEELKIQNSSLN